MMARGGKRAGAGRKPGDAGKVKVRKVAEKVTPELSKLIGNGPTPLEVLLTVMRESEDPDIQIRAANSAAPYIHKKQPQEVSASISLPQAVQIVTPLTDGLDG